MSCVSVFEEAYCLDNTGDAERIVLKLKSHLAPIKAAVIPLAKNKPELVALAQNIQRDLQHALKCPIALENSGNIGKNYRRHDEIGTPLCITIDFETLANTAKDPSSVDTVTVRDRDTLQQTRVAIEQLPSYIRNHYTL